MKFWELVKTSFKALYSNKLRTFLTTLGIIIGIMAVITLLNLGEGAQNFITKTVSSLGSNLITVVPGRFDTNAVGGVSGRSEFTQKDIDSLKNEPHFFYTHLSGYNSRTVKAQHEGETINVSLTGVSEDYWVVREKEVAMGRKITDRDDKSLARVAVVGPDVVDEFFPDQNPVGQEIKINGISLIIVGVATREGSIGITNPDQAVTIPLQTYQKVFTGESSVNAIYIRAKDKDSIDVAESEIRAILMRTRGLGQGKEADFTIRNAGEVLNILNQITSLLTSFLIAIGAISLLVGGIGIMNIMFVTVRERTREIGLRKALGATNNDIMFQFLIEAVVITMLGGAIGTFIGVVLSLLIAAVAGFDAVISINSILLAVGVSGAIGLVFGIYPARKAAQLSPIEALRFE